MACAYRGTPNDAVVFACILEAARNTAFWQCLHTIRGIREIRGGFLLLKDISMTTGLNRYQAYMAPAFRMRHARSALSLTSSLIRGNMPTNTQSVGLMLSNAVR